MMICACVKVIQQNGESEPAPPSLIANKSTYFFLPRALGLGYPPNDLFGKEHHGP